MSSLPVAYLRIHEYPWMDGWQWQLLGTNPKPRRNPFGLPLHPQVAKSFLPPKENLTTKVLAGVPHHPDACPGNVSLKSHSHRCKLIALAARRVFLAHNISWVDNVCWRLSQGAKPPGHRSRKIPHGDGITSCIPTPYSSHASLP